MSSNALQTDGTPFFLHRQNDRLPVSTPAHIAHSIEEEFNRNACVSCLRLSFRSRLHRQRLCPGGTVALIAMAVMAALLATLSTFVRELLEGKHWPETFFIPGVLAIVRCHELAEGAGDARNAGPPEKTAPTAACNQPRRRWDPLTAANRTRVSSRSNALPSGSTTASDLLGEATPDVIVTDRRRLRDSIEP